MLLTAQALLFDMDGVLVDSALAVERVWRRWAVEHGLDPAMVIGQAHGRRSIETLRVVAPHLDAARENVMVEQREIEDKEGVIALDGAARVLRALPPERFAVVTSATRPLAVARLGHAALPLPENIVCAEDVVQGKPSPEPYQAGAALLRVRPADCVVFEDTPAGIVSARSAGMRVIAVGKTYPRAELHAADAHIASLAVVQFDVRETNIALEIPGP